MLHHSASGILWSMKIRRGIGGGFVLLGVIGSVVVVSFSHHASANRYESPSFTIDASVGNSFGGTSGSSSYGLVSSGGEAIIGNGASGSYRMTQGYIAQLEKSLQLNVQPYNLEAYYPFETATGTRVYDNTANNINAVLPSGVTRATGKLDQSLSFDGTNGVDLGNPGQLQITENQTISMWLKPTDFSVAQNPFAKARGGEGAIMQSLDGKLTYSYGTSGGNASPYQSVATTAALPLNEWTHVSLVRDLSDMTITWYINGQQDTQVTASYAAAASSSLSALIGNGDVGGYRGSIDELKIFSRTLTALEVRAEYDANTTGNRSGSSLNAITPGISQRTMLDTIVQTDSPSYGIAVSQNQDLTSGEYAIGAIGSGSITTPSAWDEGATKGFGFTLTSGTALPVKWGTDPNSYYAAIPTTPTTFYVRSGYTGGVKDVVTVQYRLDTPSDQVAGDYTNTVTYTATMIP